MAAIHAALASLVRARRSDRRPDRDVRIDAAASCSGRSAGSASEVDFVDTTDLRAVAAALAAAPTRRPLRRDHRQPDDVPRRPRGARRARAPRTARPYVVDNTFASPYVCRPLDARRRPRRRIGDQVPRRPQRRHRRGRRRDRRDLIAGVERVQVDTGATLGPLEAFLVLRGILTLAIRAERHAATAAALGGLARASGRRAVRPLPGTASHPQHDVALRQFRPGVAGGMMAFEVEGGRDAGRARDRRADAPRIDRLARERPHDGRPPAVDLASPVDRGRPARRPGSRPGCCASRSGSRISRTSRPTSRPEALGPRPRRNGAAPPDPPSGPSRPSTPSRGSSHREPGRRLGGHRTRPSGRNIPARMGYGLWHLFTSVDFAVFQIIFLALLAVVGMTIKQLPDFAFRSATDYATAMDQLHARYDPVLGAGDRGHHGAAVAVLGLPLAVVQRRAASCSSSRSSSARSTGRPKLWRGVSDVRVAQPEPYLRSAPARPRRDGRRPGGRRPRRSCGGTASTSARRPMPTAPLPVRRPPPVHQDGDAVHACRADHLPHRRRGDLPAGRRAGPGRRRGRIADRPADRDARAAAGQEHRLRGARLRHRQADRLHDRPRRLPGRQADRAQDDPGQRPAVGRRATRSTRTGSGRPRTSSSRRPPARSCGTRRSR